LLVRNTRSYPVAVGEKIILAGQVAEVDDGLALPDGVIAIQEKAPARPSEPKLKPKRRKRRR